MANKYSQFFMALKELNNNGAAVTKEEVIHGFSKGRTTSLSALSDREYKQLLTNLSASKPKADAEKYKNDPLDNTRKAIISQFKSIGGQTADAIAWAEKYGVNGIKRKFNDYTGQELFILLQNSKKVKLHKIKQVTNSL